MSAVTPLEVQRLGRLHGAWRSLIHRNGGVENTLAVLKAAEPQQKTPPVQGGASGRTAIRPAEKDTTNMTAVPLFAKEKEAPPPRKTGPVTEAQQLQEWLRRGTDEVFTVTTLLTPGMAGLLLAHNDDNRPMVAKGALRSVEGYAAAMRRGEWALNGEPIIVSRCGQLNDGQNRCQAVVEAGVAVPVLLTFGVERDTRHTVDQGIARTPGHILAMWGEKNTNQLACVLQFLWAQDNEISLNYRPSTDQLRETLGRHPEAREAIRSSAHVVAHYRLSAGYIAGAHYLCRRHDAFSADQFLSAVTDGLNIQNPNSPVARLRKQFEEHSAKRKKLDRIEQAALYIKGYNNFRRGRTGVIAWRNTGPTAESFPTVGG